ncbi:MAG: hypothetical protein RLZZ435_2660 [Cyanobacteriota bacterium]|jgi:hypothetical protein
MLKTYEAIIQDGQVLWLAEKPDIPMVRVFITIEGNKLLDIIQHPNQEKYPNQRIFIVEIDRYIYLVPFIENETELFLKTIIPSRKMTKKYLGE